MGPAGHPPYACRLARLSLPFHPLLSFSALCPLRAPPHVVFSHTCLHPGACSSLPPLSRVGSALEACPPCALAHSFFFSCYVYPPSLTWLASAKPNSTAPQRHTILFHRHRRSPLPTCRAPPTPGFLTHTPRTLHPTACPRPHRCCPVSSVPFLSALILTCVPPKTRTPESPPSGEGAGTALL